jgi:hypothetical protein
VTKIPLLKSRRKKDWRREGSERDKHPLATLRSVTDKMIGDDERAASVKVVQLRKEYPSYLSKDRQHASFDRF